jgi:hypothetical protein
MDDFDTPSVDELEQGEGGFVAIPVRVEEPIRVDQLPTILVDPKTHVIQPGEARQILREDPRRARVTLIVSNNDVMVSGRPGNLDKFAGGFIPSGLPIPLHGNYKSALYARPVLFDGAGTDVVFGPAADVAVVTVFEEYWAK